MRQSETVSLPGKKGTFGSVLRQQQSTGLCWLLLQVKKNVGTLLTRKCYKVVSSGHHCTEPAGDDLTQDRGFNKVPFFL